MPVSITHVIGTVALLAMLIAVGFAFSVISSYIEADLMKQQLADVAEYVALNLGEVISLADASNQNVEMTKIIKLPETIAGRAYVVTLEVDNASYYARASMVSRPDIVAESRIPLNATGSGVVLLTKEEWPTTLELMLNYTQGTVPSNSLYPDRAVYGGNSTHVVWAYTFTETEIWAGIGRMTPP